MCRWLAYFGSPVLLEDVLFKPSHSLIDQSLHSDLGVETTNGDGFGVGWYDREGRPGIYRVAGPAWSDRNLADLSAHVESGLFLAHIRASTGTAVQQTNCHPFRYDRWLWVHNGLIRDFPILKRDLVLAVEPSLYPAIQGSTDSELMFFLALTFGLEKDPTGAVARMVGFVEAIGHSHGVEHPIQMTIGTSDGEKVWAFRYSSEGHSRTLFFSTDARALKRVYGDNPTIQRLSDEARLVVSEPLGDLPGAWNEVPEGAFGIVQEGDDELGSFQPEAPSLAPH